MRGEKKEKKKQALLNRKQSCRRTRVCGGLIHVSVKTEKKGAADV